MSDKSAFPFGVAPGKKRHAPATDRNRDAITALLKDNLPRRGTILEIASGTGQHISHFASVFPALGWQPSDAEADALESISTWAAESGQDNIRTPLLLDVCDPEWPIESADGILCINMIHIAPWAACEGLFAGAAGILPKGGLLYLYGPYIEDGVSTAESNLAFDASLKSRNLAWGLRKVSDVEALAGQHGFALTQKTAMPANNLSLVFRKR